MNTLVIAFFAVVAIVAAAPPPPAPATAEPIPIVRQISEVNPDGSYVSQYETGNGISVSEEGSTKVEGKDLIQVVKGTSSYSAPDGTLIETRWWADETGYHAEGAHLPVGPEIPAYIARSLEWSAAHPYEEKEEEHEKKL